MLKKIIIPTTLLTLLLLGYQRLKSVVDTIKKIQLKVVGLHSIQSSPERITAKLDIRLTNPTPNDLGLDKEVIEIDKVEFYNRQNGKLIGSANVGVKGIKIGRYNHLELQNILFEVPAKNILENIIFLTQNSWEDNIYVNLELTSAGIKYNINSSNIEHR